MMFLPILITSTSPRTGVPVMLYRLIENNAACPLTNQACSAHGLALIHAAIYGVDSFRWVHSPGTIADCTGGAGAWCLAIAVSMFLQCHLSQLLMMPAALPAAPAASGPAPWPCSVLAALHAAELTTGLRAFSTY